MMKRTIAAALTLLTICGFCVPANAADSETKDEQTPVRLSFDTLEKTVRENNVSIKAYNSTLTSVEKTDPGDGYIMEYWSAENEIDQYKKQIAELDEAIAALGPDEDALRETLKAQRKMLQQSLDAAIKSYNAIEDKEDDDEDSHETTVASTRRKTENSADLICKSAENTYISLQSLAYTRNEKERSLSQLDRSIAVMQTQVARGMAGQNDLKSLQSQREALLAGLGTVDTQSENMKNTLAVQCGYPIGTRLIIAALPQVTEEELGAVSYEADLAEAVKNSYAIWEKEDAARQASDDYENNKTNNLYAYKAAQINVEAEKENVKASFRKLYKALEEAKTQLAAAQADFDMAQKTFHVEETKFQRGMLSQIDYAAAKDTMAAAQETINSAKIDLLTAYNDYKWAKRGVMSTAS